MCLSIPSQVVQLYPEDNCVTVDTLGVQRRVSCILLEEPLQVGDYVLLHIGFVMSKIDQEEAQASLESFRQMVALMPNQDILPC
ncbi:HypC/HybG/HupF family hydrogenase formation chaperone [Aeromonas hydrophila]|uniref:HypC/HybG/HupF family hydrogenase formation chaperone n=1 Tax=Aeromonas hydrophila TaxID=644 RepID=UPI001C5A61A4|nr:HypC/HybG/HupF family hydrogenase formation chaperone [Aeromonas hydrophila]MBW3797350.1 HypC/HybG/HupF family hydrogenase formation chaperone [Aeromonas hydrophila]MBW3799530.1 HypC/HybG/HupF family hydrogenase formation chaperone [Aeromonas hydrophila]MBW3820296.1 HypC/HybG/HupF family hydrogenase formation chaperone [Aeromonas hydrophila]